MSFNINNMLNSVQHYTSGNKSVAVVVYNDPPVFIVSNNGNSMNNTFGCCAISSDGKYIMSYHFGSGVYLSTNYGSTFNGINIISYSGAISGNGQYMAIGQGDGFIHISTNYGKTFINITTSGLPTGQWRSIKMSYDGIYLLASAGNQFVYLSKNAGATFAVTKDTSGTNISAGEGYNTDIAMSKTGQYMVCVKNASPYDLIKISTDYGVTWKQKNLLTYFSTSCAVSEDGQTIYIGSNHTTKLYKITDLSNNSPTITQITAASAIKCSVILLATDPLYIFISDKVSKKMWYSITGGTTFTQVVTTAYFSTGAITPDKRYIIGNDIPSYTLLISGP